MDRKKYMREWAKAKRAEDPEAFKQSSNRRAKKSYRKHRKTKLQYAATYRKNNPDKVKAATDKWFSENKEYRRKYKAEYRKSHRTEIAAYQKANKQRSLVYKANRKTRLTKAGGSFTVGEWRALCDRHGNKCLCCKKKRPLTVDHVIPVSKGGTSNIENIQPLCGPCNSTKRDEVVDFRKANK